MGALEVTMVVDKHQVWRLFTCIWLHAGVFHVLANMLSLIFIGIRLEQEFGFGMDLILSLSLTFYYGCSLLVFELYHPPFDSTHWIALYDIWIRWEFVIISL